MDRDRSKASGPLNAAAVLAVVAGQWYKMPIAMSHKKPHLPEKTCLVCGRSFSWRRKWADCWDDVKYCSEKCRRNKTNKQDQE
ncbi:MAG: DUF2256 domain-containing protein [Desulfosarcina sp.]|nr:DUF2256 domain-containing protein [Desulfosarcina sp.]